MEVRHDDPELEQLETNPDYRCSLARALRRSFVKKMILVREVPHEAELNRYASLHCEKLQGDRSHQRSLRLNDQWRLIFEIEQKDGGNVFVVKAIEDYH